MISGVTFSHLCSEAFPAREVFDSALLTPADGATSRPRATCTKIICELLQRNKTGKEI